MRARGAERARVSRAGRVDRDSAAERGGGERRGRALRGETEPSILCVQIPTSHSIYKKLSRNPALSF